MTFSLPSPSCLLKVSNSAFGTRGKGTNGASARVLKNNFYFDDVTKNKVFLSNIKTHIGRVPDGEFF